MLVDRTSVRKIIQNNSIIDSKCSSKNISVVKYLNGKRTKIINGIMVVGHYFSQSYNLMLEQSKKSMRRASNSSTVFTELEAQRIKPLTGSGLEGSCWVAAEALGESDRT